jgi:hypothetical protein
MLSQIDPVHTTSSYLSEKNVVLLFHLRLGIQNELYSSGILIKILLEFLFSPTQINENESFAMNYTI